nr:MAG TPA: Inhibitor of sigma-G Gin [Caudoviricetes sp.]
MITISQEQQCGECGYHVYHFSPVSQDYDYYTCKLGLCPRTCNASY